MKIQPKKETGRASKYFALEEGTDLLDVSLLAAVHQRGNAFHRSPGRPRGADSADWIHFLSEEEEISEIFVYRRPGEADRLDCGRCAPQNGREFIDPCRSPAAISHSIAINEWGGNLWLTFCILFVKCWTETLSTFLNWEIVKRRHGRRKRRPPTDTELVGDWATIGERAPVPFPWRPRPIHNCGRVIWPQDGQKKKTNRPWK